MIRTLSYTLAKKQHTSKSGQEEKENPCTPEKFMNALLPHTIPTDIAAFDAKLPALFLPSAKAAERFFDFFTSNIRNKNTRRAYYKAACKFSEWCASKGIHDLASVKPLHVTAYIEVLQEELAKPTVKQYLAAIRMLFDWLVVGHVVGGQPRPCRAWA